MNKYQSILLITDALTEHGFTCEKLRIEGAAYRKFTKGSKIWLTPTKYVNYPFVSRTLRLLSVQKHLAYEYVHSQGYAVPETTVYKVDEPVNLPTSLLERPLVVKPANGSGSTDIIRDITDASALLAAIEQVHLSGCDALAQNQFTGQEIRLTVIDGEVAAACLHAVPQLVGDGKHTIAELLATENHARAALVFPHVTYAQMTPELITIPHDMARVPAPNEIIKLSESVIFAGGLSLYSVDDELHASYKDIGTDLARKLHTSFLVIDLLVDDYRQAATPTNYVFLEFNTAPSVRVYYGFRDGKHFDILPRLVQKIEAEL